MISIDEIKTIIVLSGRKRLPDLEEEIFADNKLTRMYLLSLCKEFPWASDDDSNTWLAFVYVRDELQERWPVAEEILKSHEHWWKRYKEVTGYDHAD